MRLRLDRALVLAVPWAWLLLFLVAPAAIVLAIAFSEPRDGVPPYAPPLQADPAGTWRLHVVPDSFALLFEDALYVRALLLSLQVAGVSTLGCLLIGYPMALAIARAPAAAAVRAAAAGRSCRSGPAFCCASTPGSAC